MARSVGVAVEDYVPTLESITSGADVVSVPAGAGHGSRIWPGAEVLSEYILCAPPFWTGKTVLELGAGLGLCGMIVASIGGNATISDGNDQLLQVVNANIKIHRILHHNDAWAEPDVCCVDWGSTCLDKTFDLIMGSDLAYEAEAAQPLWTCVNRHLSHSADAAFIMAHELRRSQDIDGSTDEALDAMLAEGERHGFTRAEVPLSCFSAARPAGAIDEIKLFVFQRPLQ